MTSIYADLVPTRFNRDLEHAKARADAVHQEIAAKEAEVLQVERLINTLGAENVPWLEQKLERLKQELAKLEVQGERAEIAIHRQEKGWAMVIWQMVRIGDNILDHQVDGWSEVMGQVMSLIGTAVMAGNALAIMMMALGPLGVVQGAVMLVSGIIAGVYQQQGYMQAQALKESRKANAEILARWESLGG